MRRLRSGIAATVVTVLAFALGACGSQDDPAAAVAGVTTTTTGPGSTAVKVAVATDFDPARFSNPTTVGNRWFPLKPGIQLTYEGPAIADEGKIDRKVVFTVTDLTKAINGVRAVVGWDQDYNDGQLVEPELVFFAQDDDGNVWTLGQYPEVLVTEEWDQADPAARQLKYYANGVGNVRVGWAGRDEEKEVLELTRVAQLGPTALAEVRRDVLKLERRAYKVSKHLYGRTPPAKQSPG